MSNIMTAILNGDHDDEFDAIYAAIKERRKALDIIKQSEFNEGMEVRFNSHASPKYLQGTKAIITKVVSGRKSVEVRLAEDVGKFRAGSPVRCPVSIIDAA
ncbi:MAG: hypothetical protein R3330_09310 [Saprospiraceae bacterium]|nr:hypothetical protein [Saprospiraceae bacterium]